MNPSDRILAKSFINKSLFRRLFIAGLIIVMICLVGVVWAHFNWDNYTETYQNVFTGRVKEKGWAPTIYGWGIGVIISVLFIMFIVWRTVDFKNPSLIVHENGLTINKEFFKNAFVSWEEMEIKQNLENQESAELQVYFKDSKEIVNRHKGISKAFLTQNYIKDQGSFTINKNDDFEVFESLITILSRLEKTSN